MANNTNYVTERLFRYLLAIVKKSKENQPAFVNAAHGGFRDHMLDSDMVEYGRPAEVNLEGEDLELFNIFLFYYSELQGAFRTNENHESDISKAPGEIIFSNIGYFLDKIVPILVDVITLITDDENAQKAKVNLIQDAKKLAEEVKNKPIAWSGRHMSGHVARQIAESSRSFVLPKLDAVNWKDADVQKVVYVWRDMLTKLAQEQETLTSHGHNPWLKAEWQVSYQILLEATTKALLQI